MPKTASRIYLVKPKGLDIPGRLVNGPHPAAALRHVAQDTMEVRIPSQSELVELGRAGVEIETAGAEPT